MIKPDDYDIYLNEAMKEQEEIEEQEIMKVYYQELNNQKCIGDFVDELRCDIEDAIYEYYYGKINDSDAEVIAETTLYEIRKLDVGKYITKFGFNWGVMEMTREEFDNLGEFSGF